MGSGRWGRREWEKEGERDDGKRERDAGKIERDNGKRERDARKG